MQHGSQIDIAEKKFSCHVPDQWKSKVRRKRKVQEISIAIAEKKKESKLHHGVFSRKELEFSFGIDSGMSNVFFHDFLIRTYLKMFQLLKELGVLVVQHLNSQNLHLLQLYPLN